jgi:cytidylate kinase
MGISAHKANGVRLLTGLLICFSGRIGSGKSSVSEILAARLGWKRSAFGEYLRTELARRGGDVTSREALQDLGQSLVETDTEAFCSDVLSAGGFRPGDNFLVDGVRHADIQRMLAVLASPSVARLIFLAADDANRFQRIADRPDGQADFARAEAHKVEADLKASIPAIADLSVDSTQDIDLVIGECLAAIHQWMEQ